MSKIRVGIVQQSVTSDKKQNLSHSANKIRSLAKKGADLVVLQELHATPYFCQTESLAAFDLAEPIPGPSSDFLGAVAKETGVVLVSSLFEARAAGLYHNTAVVFEKTGEIAGTYRKMHIPDDPGYYEKYYFTPGDLGFKPIQTSLGKLGVLVCWDQWYPEAARLMALAGAEYLIYPTAIGWDLNDSELEQNRQQMAWQTIQQGHAIANGLPVIVANRVGFEAAPEGELKGQQFWGHSFVADSGGTLCAAASSTEEELLLVELDRQSVDSVRRSWPFLRDRRIDAYEGLLSRYLDFKGD